MRIFSVADYCFRYLAIFWILLTVAIAITTPKLLQAQKSTFDDELDACAGNDDCGAYALYHSYLLGDEQFVAIKGKKKERRVWILQNAANFILAHRDIVASTPAMQQLSYFKYMRCVSEGLNGEFGEKKTLFSSENIIETYFAIVGTATGIQFTCDLLHTYYTKWRQAKDDARILQKKKDNEELDPQEVWHNILKNRSTSGDAELEIRSYQDRFCLFAIACPKSQNSPFASK